MWALDPRDKITKDVARAKHELAFDVIAPLGKTREEGA